jgi:superfamily II DNA or RNA helicase
MQLQFQPGSEGYTLRPYQAQAVDDLRASLRRGHRRLLLQAGTGSGKTIIASEIIKSAVGKGKLVLFLAHRRELIDQCSAKLDAFGVRHGIIMAGRERQQARQVQVASIQTLWSRAMRRDVMTLPSADLVVLDECHRSLAPTYLKLIEHYGEEAVVLGMTATPCRGDGRGLGGVYEDMVQAPSVAELTKQGYLVPVRYFAPSAPDLHGVRVRMGDYVEGELEERMDKEPLIGNLVETWGRLADGRKTVVFATGVKHSIHIRDEFLRAGVACAHIDGNTPLDEREDTLYALLRHDLQVVTNCMVLTEGWDCPPVSCCVLARPTKSIGLYLQMAGRTLRPWEGKTDCLLLDHSSNVATHGFVDQPVPWALLEDSKVQDRVKERKRERKDPNPVVCPQCKAMFIGKAACPACGWRPQRTGEEYRWVDGQLVEVTSDGEKDVPYSQAAKLAWYRQLVALARSRGYKEGWIAHTYKKKFGAWPPRIWQGAQPEAPSPEVLGYVRHLAIKYAKRREAQTGP